MNKKVGTGIWFIFFGIIILLDNFDVIDFNFYALLDYWPLIIIAVGIHILLQNRRNGPMWSALVSLCMCIFLLYIGLTSTKRFNLPIFTSNNSAQDSTLKDTVTLAFPPNVNAATLTFDLGAAALVLDSLPSKDLIQASSPNGNGGLKVENNLKGDRSYIEITGVTQKASTHQNSIHLALNTAPIWSLKFNMGAASFTGHLAPYKFTDLEINAGVTSLTLHLGMPRLSLSTIEINTAASSCTINLPKTAACQIEHDSMLSSQTLEGFVKEDNTYKTENYDQATNKYLLKIKGAANSIAIHRI
ncbi:hypothetical protein G5B30_15390 [Sphingobacterium sp. SGG-5]|uniref:LiaF transmembrane domain-containing protein n=1 Tax=Sphingobacterium sp. SGG-5 TaxID=2710881 RepID=UPI0013EA1221|nr:DUF5668 domain-containing protein [Sphingobacterium sp. SGG-5]NGM63292.1 hypothetical protein [Sphingobacterium sp. SGG-5]